MNEINHNQVNYYKTNENDENQRIDNLLVKILKGVPKSHIYRIIRSGEVRINQARCNPQTKITSTSIIRIPPIRIAKADENKSFIPQPDFEILFEDDYYLIINKPTGIACHGGSGISFGIIEQLRHSKKFKFLELAHRLDRETSGILVLAKKRQSLVKFQELSQSNLIIKKYYALTYGVWNDEKRNVKAPISKYNLPNGERRVKIDFDAGQFAHTVFTTINKYSHYTLVSAQLKTGKTHQIRIHCKHLGFPIVNDDKYADLQMNKEIARNGFKRMFLHAYYLEFTHPISAITLTIDCPLPAELQDFVNKLH